MKTISILVNPAENDKYKETMARAKGIIFDRVKDHVVPHIAKKEMINEMSKALKKLY